MPKRKLEECLSDGQEGTTESDDSNISSQTNGSTDVPSSEKECFTQLRKRPKKGVKFDGVKVFYFPRKQGFTCVPSQGGSTLGMSEKHSIVEEFSMSEYGKLQRQIHRSILKEQQKQGKLGPNKLRLDKDPENSSDNESPSSDSEEDLNIDDYYFLQPVSTRQRRILLRQAGIKKIDTIEKEDCKDIRSSREVCGCDCRVYCDPMSCSCSLAGIKCQVDRLSFPCGCSKDGCANVAGRVEFNPIRVRTHFIHTLMRLELEKKGEQVTYMKQSNYCQKSPSCSSEGDTSQTHGELESCVQDIGSAGDGTRSKNMDLFNSNEQGSCRDCQKSELHDVVIQETKMCVGNKDHEMEACTSSRDFPLHQESHGNNIRNLGTTEQGESLPQVMLFNEEEEEEYHGENTTNMYQFKNSEESSYSESSDCSSEGSNDALNFHSIHMSSFQTMNHSGGEQAHSNQTNQQNFCIPNDSSDYHHTANAEPEQKYHHLNSASSGYKLEPISEILNPIRFPNYSTPSSQQGWGNCETDAFNADFPNPNEQQQQQQQVDQGGYFAGSYPEEVNKTTDTNGTDNNRYPYASNATENHSTGESMCIMNNVGENQSMGEQYLNTDGVGAFQDINSYNSSIACSDMNSQSYMNGSYVESLENEASCNQMGSGSCDQNYTNLDMTTNHVNDMNKISCHQDSGVSSTETSLKVSNKQNANEKEDIAEDKAVYHDLSTMSQKPETGAKSVANVEENGKTTAEGSFSAVPIKAIEPALLSSECSPIFTPLESKKIQNKGMENGKMECPEKQQTRDIGHKEGSREKQEDITQNFGEIIKESIVETVSA